MRGQILLFGRDESNEPSVVIIPTDGHKTRKSGIIRLAIDPE